MHVPSKYIIDYRNELPVSCSYVPDARITSYSDYVVVYYFILSYSTNDEVVGCLSNYFVDSS